MNSDYPSFIFVRHAESKKNLRDITGGLGEHLTHKGQQEAISFSEQLLTRLELSKRFSVISSDAPQAIDTAKQISKQLNKDLIISDEISPAGLGIAGGLSSAEIAKRFPEISKRFSAWRNQEIEAIDLQIPSMESPEEFWNRIIHYLMAFEKGTSSIIVCTRSVMVLVANLVSGKRPYRGGGYKHIDVEHCGTIAFSLLSCQDAFTESKQIAVKLLPHLTTVKLEDNKNV